MDTAQLAELFTFSVSPLSMMLRGTAMYALLFVVFRFVLRRDVGSLAGPDILLLVIVVEASRSAMAGDYRTIADGVVLVGTIVTWTHLVDWTARNFPNVHFLLETPPLLLVYRGRVLHRHLRQKFLTLADLMRELRKQGVEDIGQVHRAYMEGDGHISVLREDVARF